MHDAIPRTGAIAWVDLTVADTEGIRDFYQNVVGWREHAVDMGGEVVVAPRVLGGGSSAVIRDPAGVGQRAVPERLNG